MVCRYSTSGMVTYIKYICFNETDFIMAVFALLSPTGISTYFALTSDALKIEPNSVVFYYCGWFEFNASDVTLNVELFSTID